MNRRELMLLLGGVVTAPLASRAQQKAMPVIDFLSAGSPGPSASNLAAFRQGLSETGYIETRNPARIVYEAKSGLSFRFSLHGKQTKEAEFGHVFASPICRTCVIERPGTRRTFERGHHKQCNCGRA